MKTHTKLLVPLVAFALAGCGVSSSAGKGPTSRRAPTTTHKTVQTTTTMPRTTTTAQPTTAAAPPTTTRPAVSSPPTRPLSTEPATTAPGRPDLAHLAGEWTGHCCRLQVDGTGHFRFAGRTYVWCGQGPPPCDGTVGSEIQDGALANGVITFRTGNVAVVHVSFTNDTQFVAQNIASFSYAPSNDTLTIQPSGIVLCGPSAPASCFGA